MSVPFSLVLDGTDHASNSITVTADSPSATFSLSVWFKTTNASGGTRVIISKGIDGMAVGWFLFIDNSGTLSFEIADGSNNRNNTSASGFNDGNWHNIILTFNNPTLKLYMDGSLFQTTSGLTLTNQTTQTIKIGNTAVAPSYIGQLCDIRIYSIELSSSDVTSIYAGNEPQSASRLLEWPPSEGSGTTVSDFTGNGNTLTFNAVAWSTDVPSPLRPPLTLTLTDSVSSSDSVTREDEKTIIDSLTLSDTLGVGRGQSVSDSVTPTDAFSLQSSFISPAVPLLVEVLTNQLIPAEVKAYYEIQE